MAGEGGGMAERSRAVGYGLSVGVGAIGAGAIVFGMAAWESYRDAMLCEDGAENCALQALFFAALGATDQDAFLLLGGVCGAIAGGWRLGPTGLLAGLAAAATSACLVGVVTGSMSEPSVLQVQLTLLVAAFVGGYILGHAVTRPRDPGPTRWPGSGWGDGGGTPRRRTVWHTIYLAPR